MIVERKVELLILEKILTCYDNNSDYKEYLNNNYDVSKMENRYAELGKEFLNEYALNKTEKSD